MPISMTASVASVVPVVATILGLLFASFLFILALALLTRAAGGPRRRVAFLVCAALVALAAIRLVDGPWPGGRSFWPNAVSWRTDNAGDGDRDHALVVQEADTERRVDGSEGAVADLRDDIGEAVAVARSAAETAMESVFALSTRNGAPLPVPPTAPAAADSPAAPLTVGTSAAEPEAELSAKQVAREARSTARHLARGSRSAAHRLRSEVHQLRTEVRRSARGLRGWVRGYSGEGIGRMLVTALALAAFLFVGYLFLDAGTRGQFTWSLRLVSLLAFVLFFAALALWPAF